MKIEHNNFAVFFLNKINKMYMWVIEKENSSEPVSHAVSVAERVQLLKRDGEIRINS